MIHSSRLPNAAMLLATLLGGCNLAPPYRRPTTVAIPPSFKELPDWQVATPNDAVARGDWWTLFNDPVLDGLEAKVLVSNQNLAAAKAAFDQARALVRQQRAALFPTVSLTARGTESRTFDNANQSSDQVNLGASWEPDLWGAIGNSVSQARAQAQASAGDLANAALSAQGELALDYVQLRGLDEQKRLLDTTVADYTRALAITVNRYNVGVAARSDVDQAQTALFNAQAQAQQLIRERAALEHAVAVLAGENPSLFTVTPVPWNPFVPEVPALVPSALLQRRPDVAAAERRVAAANANIGIQRAGAFPAINLTGGVGSTATDLAGLFAASTSAWSLGLTGLLTLLDFGANKAKVAGARAAWEQSVAQYRQTVLNAFQQTEDQLAAARVLRGETAARSAAAASAGRAEAIARNQYVAGTIGYADVIVAQNAALSARVAEIQSTTNRQIAAISLIEAIGGHWDASRDISAATRLQR